MRLKALLTILLSLCAVSAYAQFGASIQGTVVDKSGGVVTGAVFAVTVLVALVSEIFVESVRAAEEALAQPAALVAG